MNFPEVLLVSGLGRSLIIPNDPWEPLSAHLANVLMKIPVEFVSWNEIIFNFNIIPTKVWSIQKICYYNLHQKCQSQSIASKQD